MNDFPLLGRSVGCLAALSCKLLGTSKNGLHWNRISRLLCVYTVHYLFFTDGFRSYIRIRIRIHCAHSIVFIFCYFFCKSVKYVQPLSLDWWYSCRNVVFLLIQLSRHNNNFNEEKKKKYMKTLDRHATNWCDILFFANFSLWSTIRSHHRHSGIYR